MLNVDEVITEPEGPIMTHQNPRRVVLLGASLAARRGAFSNLLNRLSAPSVKTSGVVGANWRSWTSSMPETDPRFAETAIVFEMGGNDLGGSAPTDVRAAAYVKDSAAGAGYSDVLYVMASDWPLIRGDDTLKRKRLLAAASFASVVPARAQLRVAFTAADVGRDGVHLSPQGAVHVLEALRLSRPELAALFTSGTPPTARPSNGGFTAEERSRFSSFVAPHLAAAASASGVPAPLIAALAYYESKWDPTAESDTGAQGIGQFIPSTGTRYGLATRADRENPAKAVPAIGAYLARLRSIMPSLHLAVAAYNAGPGMVNAFLSPDPGAAYLALSARAGGARTIINRRTGAPIVINTPEWFRTRATTAVNRYAPNVASLIRRVRASGLA